ncbi:hypothetical protein ACFXGT_03165 [Streptomyces sp. NPDC059352]|uniref:hypothetical protein n=1 Tax=Streptomyces sp. NPDC059352 TaxID=3346810 RepID=UPI00369AB225
MSLPETFPPGVYTPAAGTYVCDCASAHQWHIDLAGHLFPPFPAGCTGHTWQTAVNGSPAAEPTARDS